jgi:cold shock CspA family protein
MEQGTISIYTGNGRGFGFIKPDGEHADLFFHIKDCSIPPGMQQPEYEAVLTTGTRVEYEVANGRDGKLRAVKVMVLV